MCAGNEDYTVIFENRLETSFLRYTQYDKQRYARATKERDDLMRYLAAAARYPKQVEMLRKMGIDGAVWDMVYSRRKNVAAINWKETDPRKAFGLNGQELKAFLQTHRNIYTVELYKKFRKEGKKVPMEEAAAYGEGLTKAAVRDIGKQAVQWRLEPLKLLRYFRTQTVNGRSLSYVWQTWEGYLNAAQGLGLELYKDKVLLPRDLWAAHEEVTEKHRRQLQAKKDKELREQEAREREAYEPLRKELELRYGAAHDGFIIRAPHGRSEIVNEGLILKHCVGGYADRHIKCQTTILFMRRAESPDEPFLTIEMQGKTLKQIHGYKNEGLYTTQGRFAPDPRETYSEFLEPWLEWITNGSKRNDKGIPLVKWKTKKTA